MNKQQAIELAFSHAKDLGWLWLEPVKCNQTRGKNGKLVNIVRTNDKSRGMNIVIEIDDETGEILDATYLKW